MHYPLPIDRCDQSCSPERFHISIKPTSSDTVLPVLSSCPVVTESSITQTDGELSMLPVRTRQPVNQSSTSSHDVPSNKFRNLFRECSVALLTGSNPPRLNQSEKELFETRQSERESLRPVGTCPIPPQGLDVPVWDFCLPAERHLLQRVNGMSCCADLPLRGRTVRIWRMTIIGK